ncbi:hypothetical protein KYLE_31 [Pantoea phage Kyle]|uniref:Phr family secreted Rap phosphatase inhibitor n=1 Tax=Pantoea phage Kyle TaxID=2589665 RepID=A0A514A8T3_9CAUD|nr:hypothetical protein HWC52_gp031 [Pantoea phage Kyle]QDH49683.1 hypothetical protein KYLE_31 [Pantoea phage Kyle]
MKEYIKCGLLITLAAVTFASYGVSGHNKDSNATDGTFIVKNIPSKG